jgi:menaquinone-9 beta-reductase
LTGPSYDIVTVGGGIAGAALAKAMAEQGVNVLVLEREGRFKDRVRGEMVVPWGAAEARELRILDVLKDSCAHEVSLIETGSGLRDLKTTTVQQLPALTFAHPEMQDSLLAAAEGAGAKVRRGITVERIEPGTRPTVILSGLNPAHFRQAEMVIATNRITFIDKHIGIAESCGGCPDEVNEPGRGTRGLTITAFSGQRRTTLLAAVRWPQAWHSLANSRMSKP